MRSKMQRQRRRLRRERMKAIEMTNPEMHRLMLRRKLERKQK